MKNVKTKDLVTAALLAALSMLIPNVFPTLPFGPFTATFASHVPVFVAMFVSPWVAAAAGLGSMLGFFLKGVEIYIVARAAMHIFVGIAGAFLIKKNFNVILVGALTLILHALLETVAVVPFLNIIKVNPTYAWYQLIICGTAIHHVIDYIIAYFVVLGLKRAKAI